LDSVVIGADPHKHSVTIEVLDERERVLHQGRYGTDTAGYRQMLAVARRFEHRRWAVEGCNGIGRHVAQRLVADGETVVDVPAKLAARARVFDTGNGRKSDPADAHSVAVVALRAPGLHQVRADDDLVALRLLVDRRDELGRARTQTINRLHRLLLELIPGGAKRFLTAAQAQALLHSVAPADVAGRVRHQLATELLGEIVVLDKKLKDSDKTLRTAVAATGTSLLGLHGIGPAGAARILGDVADVARFATRAHFASWNGTAPLDASSGEQKRHRLSRAGNRRINRALHIMAIVQIRHDTPRPGLLPPAYRRGQDSDGSRAGTQAATVRCGLPAAGRRRQEEGGPGRTRGGDYNIQRGRPNPDGQHFGPVTARARNRAYAPPQRRPRQRQRRPGRRQPRRAGPTPTKPTKQEPTCNTANRTNSQDLSPQNFRFDIEGSQMRTART
jgi:transposase